MDVDAAANPQGYPEHWEADVVLRDGGIARIRPIRPDDAGRLVAFYEEVSDESKYYRFFAPYPRLSDRDVRRFTHHDYRDRVGLAALVNDRFIATVRYDRIDPHTGLPAGTGPELAEAVRKSDLPATAEVAFLVQDAHQGRGVASALMEHIAAVARERGIDRFTAELLPDNRRMAKVFTDAGYTQTRSFADGVLHLELDLEPTERSLSVMRAREHRAEARSVQRLLAPRSVAVVGVGRGPAGLGRTLLRDLREAGFTGSLHAINRHAEPGSELDGVPAHRSLRDLAALDEPIDLVVVAVPAAEVPSVVADCGELGVQGLVVVSAGYAESGPEGRERQRGLVASARAAGLRVIGPNAFGIVNTDPGIRLNASLSPRLPERGRFGVFTQSGAIGAALLEGAARRGLGISSFVSAGNRADVSGNDLLQYWEEDPDTSIALLYLESFGNPRKFTRIARRTAARKPIVVIKGGRHTGSLPPGHAAATARIADSTADALFQQAGVVRVETITDLYDTAQLLADHALPAGPRVAIAGNSDSLAALAYDACLGAGLQPQPARDLGTEASPEELAGALAEAIADPSADSVIAVVIPRLGLGEGPGFPGAGLLRAATEAGSAQAAGEGLPPAPDSLTTVLREAYASAADAGKPLLVVHLALPDLPGRLTPEVPAYPAPERAVRALAHSVRYAAWRRAEAAGGRVPRDDAFPDIDEEAARTRVQAALSALPPAAPGDSPSRALLMADADARGLLADYGIRVPSALPAPDEEAAVRAAAELGYPVALKSVAGHLRHRPDLGAVRLDLPDEAQLRLAYRQVCANLGGAERARLVVQHMAPRGVDTVVRAAVDPAVGAILSFGLAGAASELLGDLSHRLIPATDRDVASQIREIKAAPRLFGWRGAEPVDTPALEDLLLRISRLVDDQPEIAALELEPVVVAPHGLTVLNAGIRLTPPQPRNDLGPRALPLPPA
ncbi:bifunctional acetate--CoA ligase family protein/GNAT family N-acetyltransferase [Phaeacidiphilus oryzae]|uniref:bifunctional acetate--CoA ligase family protein/GNAT family N-acetyltransferase n=1 Tax=Phaeacidiphilus oryzae TaxID=348818 RepID=UPI000565EDDD|nr:GNAT family N-acetyltransferase [Phaeacidiphilus oryzae]